MSIKAQAPGHNRGKHESRVSGTTDSHNSTLATDRVNLALELAALGYHVHPLHTVVNGQCTCGGQQGCKPGKHPNGRINAHGSTTATTDPATIRQWWALYPDANIGISADLSGIFVIGPDSKEWTGKFREKGLPRTMVVRSGSGNRHFYCKRPAGSPVARDCKQDMYDLISKGNIVAPGSASDKGPYTLLTELIAVDDLPEAPEWAVTMLAESKQKQVEADLIPVTTSADPPVRLAPVALDWWHGKRYVTHPKKAVDRDKTIFGIAVELCKANANVHIVADAIAERDLTLGASWPDGPVYATRSNPRYWYEKTAKSAAAKAERGETTLTFDRRETVDNVNEVHTTACPAMVAELEDKVERLQLQVRTLRSENEQIKEDRRIMLGVMRNKALKAAESMTALAVVFDLASGESRKVDKDGWIKESLHVLAENAGASKSTVSRHIGKLEEWGILEKKIIRHAPDWVNPETGEKMDDYTSEMHLKLNSSPRDTLKHLIEIEPVRADAGHGGKREKSVCPDHPDAGTHWVGHCMECERQVDQYWEMPETEEAIERHNERSDAMKHPKKYTQDTPSQPATFTFDGMSTVASCNDAPSGAGGGNGIYSSQLATAVPLHDETTQQAALHIPRSWEVADDD